MPATASQAMSGAVSLGGQREERQGETQKTVGAELQQNRGQDHRAAGGRLDVRVGQPGVQRKERHLDEKGEREGARNTAAACRAAEAGATSVV